jgi:hypothetical protein
LIQTFITDIDVTFFDDIEQRTSSSMKMECLVIDTPYDIIVGRPTIVRHKLWDRLRTQLWGVDRDGTVVTDTTKYNSLIKNSFDAVLAMLVTRSEYYDNSRKIQQRLCGAVLANLVSKSIYFKNDEFDDEETLYLPDEFDYPSSNSETDPMNDTVESENNIPDKSYPVILKVMRI